MKYYIRFWSTARTAEEITEWMPQLIPVGKKGLEAAYRFDDGGQSIEDYGYYYPFAPNNYVEAFENLTNAQLTQIFQYRLVAEDNGVGIANFYVDATNPEENTDFNTATLWPVEGQHGHALWVTGQPVSSPEEDFEDGLDNDGDGIADDGSDTLNDITIFAVVRANGST